MAELQKQLQDLSDDFQKLQGGALSLVEGMCDHANFDQNFKPQSMPARSLSPSSKRTKASRKSATSQLTVHTRAYQPLQEFTLLSDDANIYKLVGPVLLKQEKSEAVMAVDSRLQYIEKEM